MADPFLHVESGLKQIDLDLLSRTQTIITMISGLATLYTQNQIKLDTANLDIPLSDLATAITALDPSVSTIISTTVSVGTTSTSVVAANTSRRYLCLVNGGATTVFIKFGTGATVSDFPLPTGAAWDSAGLNFRYVGVVTAIVAAGTEPLSVLEG